MSGHQLALTALGVLGGLILVLGVALPLLVFLLRHRGTHRR